MKGDQLTDVTKPVSEVSDISMNRFIVMPTLSND